MTAKEKLASVKMYGRNVSEFLLPDQMEFIEIAMEEYAQQQVKNLNIPAVSKSVCKHEWIMTADSFDQTCYCKKCGKSS